VRQETFDGRSLAFRYDRAGWCVETVDHSGRRTVMERDPECRLTRVRAADKRAFEAVVGWVSDRSEVTRIPEAP
jgi:YD repeat-containing protein